jgi:RNA polymerase sigma factor (sigma-70 family)
VITVDDIDRFRAGDDDAVRMIYREYGRLVFVVANRVLSNRALAEEATQQTFLQAWKAATTFEPGRELGPWLATIARRAAIDIQRRESRRAHDDLDSVSPGEQALSVAGPNVDQAYTVWQVRLAIDSLNPDDRELVRLQHLQGYTHTQIAELLGLPVGTVKSRSFRIHKVLAARLGHLREEAVA